MLAVPPLAVLCLSCFHYDNDTWAVTWAVQITFRFQARLD